MIFFFIIFLSFPPVAGADNTNNMASIRKPYCHNASINTSETMPPDFILTVIYVIHNHSINIVKHMPYFNDHYSPLQNNTL